MSQPNHRPPAFQALQLPPTLKADCSQCSGLCCAVHAFYAYQGFGFDKPAHTACRHLNPQHRCAIHTQRKVLGFAGCIGFDCYGAGQRVTALFAGASWRTSKPAASRMFAAYAVMLVLHRLQALLSLGAALASPTAAAELAARGDRLEQLGHSAAVASGRLNTAALERETLAFLRNHVRPSHPESP